jgi:hypothetical protein
MRVQTDTYQVYTFKELPEATQQKVIERYQESAGEFFAGIAWVYDDAATIAGQL